MLQTQEWFLPTCYQYFIIDRVYIISKPIYILFASEKEGKFAGK